MDVAMSTANRPEDATQTAQEELHTNAGESVEVAHNSISQAEPSGTNDTAPARMEVASPETTSEACARILKGLAALKISQSKKMDPKQLKVLQEEYSRLVFATGWTAASSLAAAEATRVREQECMKALLGEARELLTPSMLQGLIEACNDTSADSSNNRNEALLAAGRALVLLQTLSKEEASADVAPVEEACATLARKLEEIMASWRAGLSTKDDLDAFWEGAWFRCKVVDLRPSDAASLRIHFMGYKKTHQRWADPTGADSGHPVMPAHTHTPVPPPAPPRTPKSVNSPPPSPSKTQLLAAAAAAAAAADTEAKAAAAVPTTTNRFGRAVPKAFVPKAVAAARRAENHEDDGTAAGEAASGAASGASNGGGSGGEGKSASGGGGAASDDLNDWYCSVCMAFEREDAQEDDVLLSCDGPCLRSFHVNCLGLDAVPEDELWKCEQCTDHEHACFLCGDMGCDATPPRSSSTSSSSSSDVTSPSSSSSSSVAAAENQAENVVKCSVGRCGKFYHNSCIDQMGYGKFFTGKDGKPRVSAENAADAAAATYESSRNHSKNGSINSSNTNESAAEAAAVAFVCGHHLCGTCGEKRSAKGSAHLYKCHTCPRSFHLNCVPPGSEYHEYCLVCTSCIGLGETLPPLFLANRAQDSKGKLSGATADSYRFQPERALHSACRLDFGTQAASSWPDPKKLADPKHFRLDERVLRDVESRPPMFQHITTSYYGDVKMARAEPGGSCSCMRARAKKRGGAGSSSSNGSSSGSSSSSGSVVAVAKAEAGDAQGEAGAEPGVVIAPFDGGVCGDDCENRLLRIECSGAGHPGGGGGDDSSHNAASADGSKPKANKSTDKWCNCGAGPGQCGNRQIGLRQGTVKVQPFMEEGMGWGLKVSEDVRAGQLIREYVGEVLTEQMLADRMEDHAKTNPNDVNMYVMELEFGLYLDARQKGNVSRFINHSCSPNCELQKWSVQGVTRIGIFAVKDVAAGTALSYDYQFDTREHARFRCQCGAPACRGSLSSKGFVDPAAKHASGKPRRLTTTEKKELLKRARAAEKKDLERAFDELQHKAKRLNLTAKTLPGDPTSEVRAGPKRASLAPAKLARLFLVRNMYPAGGNLEISDGIGATPHHMLKRKLLLEARDARRKANRAPSAEAPAPSH